MTCFTLVFTDGTQQLLEAETKDAMIADFCKEDCTQFQEKVKEIQWTEGATRYVENIYSGNIETSIANDASPAA